MATPPFTIGTDLGDSAERRCPSAITCSPWASGQTQMVLEPKAFLRRLANRTPG